MDFTIVFHCKQGKSQHMFYNDLEEQSDLHGLICLLFQLQFYRALLYSRMSRDVRKAVFRVFDLVPHKPGCTAIEDG